MNLPKANKSIRTIVKENPQEFYLNLVIFRWPGRQTFSKSVGNHFILSQNSFEC